MTDNEKTVFVSALAVYLAGNIARKSIALEMRRADGRDWLAMREAVPVVRGYATVSEAEIALREWLWS